MKWMLPLILILSSITLWASGKKDVQTVQTKSPDTVYITGKTLSGYKPKQIEGEPARFSEVWGWVMQGRENELTSKTVVTDVGYFAADINTYGSLSNIPKRSAIKGKDHKVHLVLVCDSRSLAHFVLDPSFGLVDKLIDDIIQASKSFDGIQVDYELIPTRDIDNFLSFITRLSKESHKYGKLFTICVPARTRLLKDDAFPYAKIAAVSDRVIIMAYDEHWSTSAPGPIASVAWARNVVKYAVNVIPKDKLVMGLPFYGRTWAREKVAQGWYHSGVMRIMRQYDSDNVRYVNDVPTVNIKMDVNVTCYFEDAYSIVTKLRLYEGFGVQSVAFWRIGQEDPAIWKHIEIAKDKVPAVKSKSKLITVDSATVRKSVKK